MANSLKIERIFDAPVDAVWKAWNDPEVFKKWWGPKDFTCPSSVIDFKENGKYLHCMRGPAGSEFDKDFWSTGTYKEIVPMKKIVATDSFADENGNVVPATHYGMSKEFPREMTVAVEFEEVGGKTKMTLTHEGMPERKDKEGANEGWNQSFDKLETILKSGGGD